MRFWTVTSGRPGNPCRRASNFTRRWGCSDAPNILSRSVNPTGPAAPRRCWPGPRRSLAGRHDGWKTRRSKSEPEDPMKRFKSIAMASLISGLLGVPAAGPDSEDPEKHPFKTHRLKRVSHWRMKAVTDFPRDDALPALVAIRACCGEGLQGAREGEGLVEFALRG